MVNTNLKKRLLVSLLSLSSCSPNSNKDNLKSAALIDSLYRSITLPKDGVEFIVCVEPNRIYKPLQKATEDGVVYDLCSDNSLGTIHSHPTHLEDYLCEPSKLDTKSFVNSKDIYMGIACYDNVKQLVYVNSYRK